MDKHNEHHHSSGFMNGFFFGLIIGAAVVFFLFTEKGKKLLKTITEEGIEGFGDLRDFVESEMDGDEDEDYEEYAEPAKEPHSTHSHVEPIRSVQQFHDNQDQDYVSPKPSKVKRFFRGIKRG